MPRPLTGGFLTTMYALRTLASKDGYLRYDRDGRPITLTQIARAVRCDVRDLRLYLSAAIASGVLAVDGPRRRGMPTLYVLLLSPCPSWSAAVAVIEAGRRRKKAGEPAPWHDRAEDETPATSGHRAPTPEEGTKGHRAPTSGDPGWGHRAPTGLGAPRPQDIGAPRPHHPGSTHEQPQEMVSVEPQLQDARGHDAHDTADGPSPAVAVPPLRAVPAAAAGDRSRTPATAAGQPPLLLPVPGPARPACAPQSERPVGALPGGWRAAVARERPEAAAAAYRDRWTGSHAHLLDDPTGT
jgi:hypothetical protein